MKKLILILFVALMANLGEVWGQLPVTPPALTSPASYCVSAIPVEASCVPAAGPLNPIPGTLYTYTVTITNGGTSPTIHWFVTDNPQFIVNGILTGDIEVVGTSPYLMATGATYNVPGNTTPTVDITWQSIPAATDIFLVTYVTNDAGCTDNIKVYKIEPVHLFTLDIDALAADGTVSTTNSDCVSPVQGAAYNSTSGEVEMDFGVNYVYFVVNAANWAHSWLPSFSVAATNMSASATLAVDWAYFDEASGLGAVWNSTTPAGGGIFNADDPVLPLTGGATGVGAAGECIVVRLTVDHNLNETLADIEIDFAVDGIMYDQVAANYTNALLGDIHYTSGPGGVPPCPWYDGYTNDTHEYTLTLRPTVDDATPPVGDDFIPTNAE